MRHAKILITLGPSSTEVDQLKRLIVAGADGFRLNFSHGSHEDHRMRATAIREVSRQAGVELAILGDLCGPKLRVGRFKNKSVSPKRGILILAHHGRYAGG